MAYGTNLCFKSTGSTTVTLNKIGNPLNTTIKYTTDGDNWNAVNGTISLSDGDKVAFSGNAKFSKNIQNRYQFTTTGDGTLTISGFLSSLVNSSTIEDDYEFNSLFSGCTNITDANKLLLPRNTTKWCYANMFIDCNQLTSVPRLPASSLADWCYSSMFAHCTSLIAAPTLPATELADKCYYCMFYGCTNLETAPALPATGLANWCYNSMFYDCRNLNNILCNFADWQTNSNATENWVTNVASNGTFTKDDDLSAIYGTNRIPVGWDIVDIILPLAFKSVGNIAVQINKQNLLYKKNNGSWQSYNLNYINLNDGETVSFRGTDSTVGLSFVTSGNGYLLLYGSPHSLINNGPLTPYCFEGLFKGCRISDISNFILPETTLTGYCYYDMFYGSTISAIPLNLLPATTLAEGCYYQMFYGCTGLSTVPSGLLPATTLAYGCYDSMFKYCTSLTTAPALPASSLAVYCYDSMFYDCHELLSAKIDAVNINYTSSMRLMFVNCYLLSSILVNFTSWSDATTRWVINVASNGTFIKPKALPEYKGVNNIPSNWVVQINDIIDYSQLPLTFKSHGTTYLNLRSRGQTSTDNVPNQNFYISRNGGAWLLYCAKTGDKTYTNMVYVQNGWNAPVLTLTDGLTVAFSGTLNNFSYNTQNDRAEWQFNNYTTQNGTSKSNWDSSNYLLVYGNVKSLHNWQTLATNQCYRSMFRDSTMISSCFNVVFENDSNLNRANGYASVFRGSRVVVNPKMVSFDSEDYYSNLLDYTWNSASKLKYVGYNRDNWDNYGGGMGNIVSNNGVLCKTSNTPLPPDVMDLTEYQYFNWNDVFSNTNFRIINWHSSDNTYWIVDGSNQETGQQVTLNDDGTITYL